MTESAIRFEPGGEFGPGMYGVNEKFTSWEDLEKKGYRKTSKCYKKIEVKMSFGKP